MIDQIEIDLGGDAFLDRMTGVVRRTLANLQRATFPVDPLFSFEVSREMSIRASAQKRQGGIIEGALRELLSQSNRYRVWGISKFHISHHADQLAEMADSDAWKTASCMYGAGKPKRRVQIDLLVFDVTELCLTAWEVKRGNGYLDNPKQVQVLRNIRAVQTLLRSFARDRLNLEPKAVNSRIILYYGVDIPCFRDIAIDRTQLDDCFGFPVLDRIEQVNEIYRREMEMIIATPPGIIV